MIQHIGIVENENAEIKNGIPGEDKMSEFLFSSAAKFWRKTVDN
jgi:hypothetical protein